ncbi:ROK family protein [Rubrobacter tropicus]|uniref:ROK family protein n=1 Tax=Rubrobacter tropicus TaxID=2653851 RepID=A0A6G8QA42_9ACTN|nr:ROK family transcriptional regulator [Rubrobacter tropicus]QIN83292.1 ROK family protein [Rubrobacter tropicus]
MRIAGEDEGRSRGRIVELLRKNGPLTRADLARSAGVSRSTASTVVGSLLASGVAVEVGGGAKRGGGQAHAGRPGVPVSLNPEAGAAVGVVFGHRHLRAVVADLSHAILAEAEAKLPVDHDAAGALDRAGDLVARALDEAGTARDKIVGVGVGFPGPLDRATGVVQSSSISPSWVGRRPAEELGRRLGLPVHLDNDANLAALAELLWGAARGTSDAVCVVLSEHIGAGLILGDGVYRGTLGAAGEIGHLTVDERGPICRCGNRGCLETLASVPAVVDLLRPVHGPDLTIENVLEHTAEGDAACRRAVGDAGRLVGAALAGVCNLLNPERVIVGGMLSEAGDVLLDPLRASLRRHALPVAATAEVVRAGLGTRTRALGAVALALRETDTFVSLPEAPPSSTDVLADPA